MLFLFEIILRMKRDAYQNLLNWKNKSNRMPLIIQGARQVGKTWLMKDFGKNEYVQTAYFNFESSIELRQIFQHGYDIKKLITSLEIHFGNTINPENTLIIFDEIQACPEALTSLKYFQENAPQFQIFAAGSLLGVAIHQGINFPVGKIEFLTLYPLSFQEYLAAIGADGFLNAILNEQFDNLVPFHSTLIEHLKKYFFIGGMPAVVSDFIVNNDFNKVREIQDQIVLAYENDFSKHAPSSQLPRIRMVWQSIVGQLAKENSKFVYSLLRTGARAKEFELAIAWLKDAGLIHKVTRVNKAGLPITAFTDWNDFKIYLNDVGLLGAMAQLSAKTLIEGNQIFEEFKGILTEQFVCQSIVTQMNSCYYWSPTEGKSEVDFLIQKENRVVPIEVKSAENVRSRSLRVYYDKYHPEECVRTSLSGYIQQDWMKNIPLYLFQQWLNNKSSS